jgi:sulfonate transport system permease protein
MSDVLGPARGGLAEGTPEVGVRAAGAGETPATRATSGLGGSPRRRPSLRWRQVAHPRATVALAQFVIVGAFLLVWQAGAGDGRRGALLDELFVGRPSLIWQQTVTWLFDGTLASNAWVTIQEALIGFAFGAFAGISAGLILGATSVGRVLIAPLVFVAYSVPRLALAPLFVLWFGIGMESKIALITVIVFFYVFFNAYEGARQVDEDLTAVCRIMKASRWQILLKVTVPSAMVWVALGLKVSVPYAFVGAVVGEILAGDLGLGALITRAVNTFDPNRLMAAVFVTTFLAIVLNAVIGRLSGFFLRWQEAGSMRGAQG